MCYHTEQWPRFFWEFGQQTNLETLEKDQTRKNTFGCVSSRDR